MIGVRINRHRWIRALFLCMALLVAADLAGKAALSLLGEDGCRRYHLFYAIDKFRLDAENNVPTWFATACLFQCGLALGAIAAVERRSRSPLCYCWLGLAVTFVLLSLDETASRHEMSVHFLRKTLHTGGLFYFAAVIPGILFALGYLAACWKFLRRLPSDTSRAFLISGFVYCAGCLGMEMLCGRQVSLHGEDATYKAMAVVEEALEMVGTLLFLRALLAYWENHFRGLAITVEAEERPAPEEMLVPAGMPED